MSKILNVSVKLNKDISGKDNGTETLNECKE